MTVKNTITPGHTPAEDPRKEPTSVACTEDGGHDGHFTDELNEFQARSRIHRQGQTAEVHVFEMASNAERYAWFDENPELTDEDRDLLYEVLVSPEWARIVTCHREGWRRICTKRARKLKKRGEDVRWLPEYDSHAWIPPHLRQDH